MFAMFVHADGNAAGDTEQTTVDPAASTTEGDGIPLSKGNVSIVVIIPVDVGIISSSITSKGPNLLLGRRIGGSNHCSSSPGDVLGTWGGIAPIASIGLVMPMVWMLARHSGCFFSTTDIRILRPCP